MVFDTKVKKHDNAFSFNWSSPRIQHYDSIYILTKKFNFRIQTIKILFYFFNSTRISLPCRTPMSSSFVLVWWTKTRSITWNSSGCREFGAWERTFQWYLLELNWTCAKRMNRDMYQMSKGNSLASSWKLIITLNVPRKWISESRMYLKRLFMQKFATARESRTLSEECSGADTRYKLLRHSGPWVTTE